MSRRLFFRKNEYPFFLLKVVSRNMLYFGLDLMKIHTNIPPQSVNYECFYVASHDLPSAL